MPFLAKLFRLVCLMLLLWLAILPTQSAWARPEPLPVYVDGQNGLPTPPGPTPGSTWENAFK